MSLTKAKKALRSRSDARRAVGLLRYFKTGPGEYGHGDVFIGVTVPLVRQTAEEFKALSFADLERLIGSTIHEERLLALLILVDRFRKVGAAARDDIYRFYIKNINFVNNWDLVDTSAPAIVGGHFMERNRKALHRMALSENLWVRRISVVATYEFIREEDLEDTLKISETLLNDRHDLIHKACGWMLREVGKRNVVVLKKFLKENAARMPRTMLRYAIERFAPAERKKWLGQKRGEGRAVT